MYTLILLAGGNGSRMQDSVPKQYLLLAGKPVIMHTMERIDRIEEIETVIIVCTKEYESLMKKLISQYAIRTPIKFALAGDSRQASVMSGLKLVETGQVILHEAARPFVTEEDFRRLIDEPTENAMYGLQIPFTVLKGQECVEELLERSELVNVQLPQKFRTEVLLEAHKLALKEGRIFTEDAGMVFTYFPDHKIKILQGMEYNIKLTTPMDLITGEMIYKEYFARRK